MKRILTLLLFVATFASSHAQVGSDFGVNMFVSASGGMSLYSNRVEQLQTGFSGNVAVGKWILYPLAMRVDFDFSTVPAERLGHEYSQNFAFADVSFLWDVTSTFLRTRNWRINAYPVIGLGLAYRAAVKSGPVSLGTDHDFQTFMGVHVPLRVSSHFDVFAEYRCRFFPEVFDFGGGDVYLHSIVAGVNCRFTDSPFSRRTQYESRETDQDWFFGIGLGPNFSSFSFEHVDEGGMYGFTPEVMFGRNYSNFWTIRFELGGLRAHEPFDTIRGVAGDSYSYSTVHADVMVNLTHALRFRRGVRLNVLPYLGAGLIWRYDNIMFDMAADAGLMFRYYVGYHSDLYIDLKYQMIPPRIGGGMATEGPFGVSMESSIFWVGIPSLTVGYIYNFGHSTTRYRLPANWSPR